MVFYDTEVTWAFWAGTAETKVLLGDFAPVSFPVTVSGLPGSGMQGEKYWAARLPPFSPPD